MTTIDTKREQGRRRMARWTSKNRKHARAIQRAYHKRHRNKIVAKKKKYHDSRKPEKAASDRRWRLLNLETVKQREKKYKKRTAARRRMLERKRRKTDIQFAITGRLRARIRELVRGEGTRKSDKTIVLIGCTVPVLMAHLESLFLPGMTWANRRLWHIDHKRPCALFDLRDPEQQRLCFHFSNLQPLWAEDNLSKGIRVAA